MFHDLNVPWTPNDGHLTRTLAFLKELGYNVVALNHAFSGKIPTDLSNPIPQSITTSTPNLKILRRVTLTLTDSHQNARLSALAKEYDLLALRPIDERTLQQACNALECDIISIDLTQRYPFYFRYKTLLEAVREGKRLELCYAQGLHGDAQARRNVISNAMQIIRACRGRGLVISSESRVGAVGCRGPWDVVNLAAVWGLGSERGVEAVGKEARAVVQSGRIKRTGYRGAVDVVDGGERPERVGKVEVKKPVVGQKRKAEAMQNREGVEGEQKGEAPISKREAKRRAKLARAAAANDANNAAVAEQGNAEKT